MSTTRHLSCPALGSETQPYSLILLNTAFIEPVYALLRPLSRYSLAADGAANHLHRLIQTQPELPGPTHIVGDLDSVDKEAIAFFAGTEVREIPSQDWNDLQKCLEVAGQLPDVGKVYIVASMYGRVDHTLAIFSSLFDPQYQGLEMVLVDQRNISLPVFPGNTQIDLSESWTRCGLIPIERSVVTTTGLQWNVHQQVMELGGLVSSSNQATARQVTITSSGKLLWTASVA